MRTTAFALAVFCSLASSATAQQWFSLSGPQASLASRGTLGLNAGEVHQAYHGSHHRGLGDRNGRCTLDGVSFVLQDQNAATRETVYFVFRNGTDARGPSTQITRIGPFTTPGGTGRSAWRLSSRAASPVVIPCNTFFSAGVSLRAIPNFNDGPFLHQAALSTCAHTRTPNHAWDVRGALNTRFLRPVTWAIHLMSVEATFLQVGNGGNDYGMGGMFPRSGCMLTARVRYKALNFAGGRSLLYGSLGRTSGIQLFPNTAKLYLGAPAVFLGAATIARTGEAVHTLARSVPVIRPGPTMHVQALGVLGTKISLSNTKGITP